MVIDRVVAVAAIVVLAPAVVVLAVLVKRHDRGPAFVRVERVGRNFEPFMMWKLRTMRADLPNGRAAGTPLTAEHDDRITPIGRRLRSSHLDELPQLLNVARGEMLLLGPRPETPEFVDHDDERWHAVLRVPSGIAGPTQLVAGDWERHLIADDPAGRAYVEVVLPVKLAIDQWYVERASLVRDLEVVAALATLLLPGHTAARLRRRIAREVPAAVFVVQGSR